MAFIDKWLEVADKKNSVLCAGIDPAEFEMCRGERGLPKGVNKRDFTLRYIESVAGYCAAFKPNIQYWVKNYSDENSKDYLETKNDMKTLKEITELVHSLDSVCILDAKLADIGPTNDAGFYHHKDKGFDAVTLALYAGNMEEAINQLNARNLGGIHMCIMSNPEYEREKNKWISVEEEKDYDSRDVVKIRGVPHVRQYIQLAHDANKFGLDGLVIGAPSEKNHIKEEEIVKVRNYVSDKMIILLPGIGTQGGEADVIWKYFDKNNVIVNVGRGLMFPNGSNSTPEEQATTANQYKKMLNGLREQMRLSR